MVKRIQIPLVVLLVSWLGACAAQFSVPSITGTAEGERLPGKVIWHDLLTDTPDQTEHFYSELFGWRFQPLADERINYTLIYLDGRMIGGMVDQNRLPNKVDISQWVMALSVADVEQAARAVSDGGGTVFTPPTSLGDRGDIAIVADNQGAVLALLEARNGDPADSGTLPAVGDFLWDELWTADLDAAVGFYSRLVPWSAEEETLGGATAPVPYRVLSSQGALRAGIRLNPVDGLKPLWLNYLRIADATELSAILERVEPLGGRILVPATLRPGGGTVAVVAGPSGAGIALQTWGDGQSLGEAMRGEK